MMQKLLHTCWFGGQRKPSIVLACRKSWERYLPDYRIAEWNERNVDLSVCRYAEEAYAAGKWAFVADYVRLWALYHHGGLYLDTDMQLLRPLEDLPLERGFLAKEQQNRYISAGIMAAPRHAGWVGALLSYYEQKAFVPAEKPGDETIVTVLTRELCNRCRIDLSEPVNDLPGGPLLLPSDWFYPPMQKGGYAINAKTYTIHHAQGSWMSRPHRMHQRCVGFVTRLLGPDCVAKLVKGKRLLMRRRDHPSR